MLHNKLFTCSTGTPVGFLDRHHVALETLLLVLPVSHVSFFHCLLGPTGLYQFSQQSHKSAPTDGWSNLLICMNSHPVSPLRFAQGKLREGLSRAAARSFASLRMTGLDLAGGEKLSRAFEPCLKMELDSPLTGERTIVPG